MSEPVSVTFVITKELRACLEKWAEEKDRSASYILRGILKQECDRREAQRRQPQQAQQKVGNAQTSD